ncbi:hypothetical protein POM88_024451 [Heracleum sosnowskyi]|uniref:Nuclear pore complex protein GP210 C-terminal Ig-like domain-containing protein n=1 Tax=Heracleum sosnowskyi TaxID=360622 RepID=A0AAD8I219_9APIA|nr:hypothetical protein POM88_024451 [Heracleum sosnowskyi]
MIMKLFPLICYLILLLASNTVSRPSPGFDRYTYGDTAGTIIFSEVYLDNVTKIILFDDHVKVHSDEYDRAASTGISNKTREDKIGTGSVNASSRGAEDISEPGSPGGFGILKVDYNSVQFNLVPNSKKSVITVINSTHVEVEYQSQDQLLITPIRRENRGRAGHAEYEVRVHSVEGLGDNVIISIAGGDGQRVEIDVNYEPEKSHTAMDAFLRVCDFILFFAFFSILVCYGCYGCFRD